MAATGCRAWHWLLLLLLLLLRLLLRLLGPRGPGCLPVCLSGCLPAGHAVYVGALHQLHSPATGPPAKAWGPSLNTTRH